MPGNRMEAQHRKPPQESDFFWPLWYEYTTGNYVYYIILYGLDLSWIKP